MDSGSKTASPDPAAPPEVTLGFWIFLSVLASTAVAIMAGAGFVAAFGTLAPGASFASAGWLVGAAVGLAVAAILSAIGFVRFEPSEREPRTATHAHEPGPPAPSF